jgi:hypothetical protein
MQPLLEDLAVSDQAASVADRTDERVDGVDRVLDDGSTGALTGQPDQRRTVTVVGLGATRAELGSGRLGL